MKQSIRTTFWLTWLVLPMTVVVWLVGPGQRQVARDDARPFLRQALFAERSEDWPTAAVAYTRAIETLPAESDAAKHRLKLAQAHSLIYAGQMVEGQEELGKLVEELDAAGQCDSELAVQARHELATASYFAAWLMRREGATAEEWLPETERARQHFRLLAERADAAGQADSETFRRNLEATIKLEQMDLSQLLAQPPPKNCPCNCKGLSQRKRQQCQSRASNGGTEKKQNQPRDDARQQIKQEQTGAGLNQRTDSGS